jgi:phage terminase large subunit-like protein
VSACIEAIEFLSKLYQVAKVKPKARKHFIDYLDKIFREGLGTAFGVEGFTTYQKDALEHILFDDIDTFVLLWSRQVGKTTMMGAFALVYVLVNYPDKVDVLVIGPALRYSGNLFDKVESALSIFAKYFNALGQTRTGFKYELVQTKTRTLIEFGWGSTIRCLPAKNVRGFSPSLILIDEASFMPEDSWQEILPMLKAKKKAKTLLILTSTPFGTTTRFYTFWQQANGGNQGYPFHITYRECPFADKEAIERELKEGLMSENEWKREYEAQFIAGEGAAIPEHLITRAIADYKIFSDKELGLT